MFIAGPPHFRLACLSWRDALPCSEVRHRISVTYKPDWEAAALELRHRLPNTALAVKVTGVCQMAELSAASAVHHRELLSPRSPGHMGPTALALTMED